MKRRLYVVEVQYDATWRTIISKPNLDAAKAQARLFSQSGYSVRVVPYGPHGERVSSRPLLVLRAKGGRR